MRRCMVGVLAVMLIFVVLDCVAVSYVRLQSYGIWDVGTALFIVLAVVLAAPLAYPLTAFCTESGTHACLRVLLFGGFLTLSSVVYVVAGVFAFPMLVFPTYKPVGYGGLDPLSYIMLLVLPTASLLLSRLITSKHRSKVRIAATLTIAAVALSTPATPLMVSSVAGPWVETAYMDELRGYAGVLGNCTANTSPQCVLMLAEEYVRRFTGTYMRPYPKPRQLLISAWNEGFINKLAATLKTGACEDHSRGLTQLIEDVYGLKTKIVVFDGWDHAMPEAEINGTWYVLDLVFTTPNNIVKTSDYAEHLSKICRELGGNYCRLYEKLIKGEARIADPSTSEDLTKEHGFK